MSDALQAGPLVKPEHRPRSHPRDIVDHLTADTQEKARRLRSCARVVLVPVAIIGAVLSYRSLYAAAVPTFGVQFALGFPLLVDLLILGASLQYIAGASIGRPMAGWRMTAHAGVMATLVLNGLAADHLSQVPWHITPPAGWAVLVELSARQVLGQWQASNDHRTERTPSLLWFTAPIETARMQLLMLRCGILQAQSARLAVAGHAASREALRLALPERSSRRVRRIIQRQVRAGSVPASTVLECLGWIGPGTALVDARPETVLRQVLSNVLCPELAGARRRLPGVDRTERGPAGREGTEAQPSQNQHRQAQAVDIVHQRPGITAAQLRIELAEKGCHVSQRTAGRILRLARGGSGRQG